VNIPDQDPQPPRPAADVFVCPLPDCEWRHEAPAIYELPEGITADQLGEYSAKRTAGIEQALTLHFTGDHKTTDWVNEVSRLRTLLRERPPLICALCFVDRHNAREAGQPLPPQELAQLVVNGNAICPAHLSIVDGPPPTPGRTGSGLIVPGT